MSSVARRTVSIFVVWLVVHGVVASTGALAGSQTTQWYETTWEQPTLSWRFTDSFPEGRFRKRLFDGARRWNALEQGLSFEFTGPDTYSDFEADTCPDYEDAGKNAVHWGHVDGGGAFTLVCSYTIEGSAERRYHSFQIKIDSSTRWYTGVERPGLYREDLWSYASHEFGHATGRVAGGDGQGHFFDSSKHCVATPKAHNTMCQTAPRGSIFDRTLDRADRYFFARAY